MRAMTAICLGFVLAMLTLACEPPSKPPAKVTGPTDMRVERPPPAASASAVSSAESVPTQPLPPASASAATPAHPPCPPEIAEPADGLAWVSGCQIRIREKIVFDLEKSKIKPESYKVIDAVGEILLRNPELHIQIAGHLGDPHRQAYGRVLSRDRAKSVMEYLITKKGIPPTQMEYQGYENDVPIADWRTEEGRAQNRRIEFKILGWGGQIR